MNKYVVTIAFTDSQKIILISGIIDAVSVQEALGKQVQKCEEYHKSEINGRLMSTYTVVPILPIISQ